MRVSPVAQAWLPEPDDPLKDECEGGPIHDRLAIKKFNKAGLYRNRMRVSHNGRADDGVAAIVECNGESGISGVVDRVGPTAAFHPGNLDCLARAQCRKLFANQPEVTQPLEFG